MNSSGDTAEQVVRLSLEGTEVALKLTGAAAKNIAAALYAVFKNRDRSKTKGHQRLSAMLKSGKELKVFTISEEHLRQFAKDAKRYGVVYCALRGKDRFDDGMVDLMVRAEDASKINRIVEWFKLATVDAASIKSEIEKAKTTTNVEEYPDTPDTGNDEKPLDEMLGIPSQEAGPSENPKEAQTEKSPPSEPTFEPPNKADKPPQQVADDPGKFQEYLDVQSRFDRYSATNALLIMYQKPDATRVMDFDAWKERGAHIKRHSEGICILEPGGAYERDDSSIGTSWNVKKVFDISQTTARAKRNDAPKVDDRLLLKALINNPPVPIQLVDELAGNAVAVYDHQQRAIFVRRNTAASDLFRFVSVALARAEIAANRNYDPDRAAFTSYCVSYILGKKYGMDVSNYNFSKAPTEFNGLDTRGIRAVLSEIRDSAHEISSRWCGRQ